MADAILRIGSLMRTVLQIALSVFATDNDDRFYFTYREFADVSYSVPTAPIAIVNKTQMLRAIDFTDHPTEAGLLRPPRRFREFEKGTTDFPYNPVSVITDCTVVSSADTTQDNRDLDSNMSYRKQQEYVLEIGQCGARLTNHRMKMLLKEYYGMKMHYFQPMPHHEWVNRVN